MRAHLLSSSLAFATLLVALHANASTAIGTENALGNAHNQSGSNPVCYPDETGLNPLASAPSRTPTGFLYDVPCVLHQQDNEVAEEEWNIDTVLGIGALYSFGDDNAYYFNEYADWNDGPTVSYLDITGENRNTGSYFSIYGGSLGRDDQFLGLEAGRYGSLKVTGFLNQIPHLYGTGAQTIFQGVGTGNLTLPAGMTPGTGTPVTVGSVVDDAPEFDLGLERMRAGLGVEYSLSSDWRVFANYKYEDRDGTKPYSGAFFFSTLIGPGFGGVTELIQPI